MFAKLLLTQRPAPGAGIVMVCGSQAETCRVRQRGGRLAILP